MLAVGDLQENLSSWSLSSQTMALKHILVSSGYNGIIRILDLTDGKMIISFQLGSWLLSLATD